MLICTEPIVEVKKNYNFIQNTFMKKAILMFLAFMLFFGVASELQKKIIRNKEFDIECYVSLKTMKTFENHKMYYWFKSGEIHKSLSASGGLVLHENYIKHYRTNQLAEQGRFNYGLKDGVWKEWFENGNMKSELIWSNGYRHGTYVAYDSFGNIETKGFYRNNMRSGRWINFKTKDTLNYKKDALIVEDTLSQKGFFGRLLTKRDSIQKVQDKQERILKRKNDSIEKVIKKKKRELKKKKKPGKENFFQRLFRKKDSVKQKDKTNLKSSQNKSL